MAESLGEKLETVLVVDDTDFVREVLVAILKYANFAVLQANNGPNALKLAANYAGRNRLASHRSEDAGNVRPLLSRDPKTVSTRYTRDVHWWRLTGV